MSSSATEPGSSGFKKLLSPLQIGSVQLKNRVVMGSMHTGLEETRDGFKKMAAYFGERARGEVGLIITGGFSPNLAGRVSPFSAQLSHFWQVKKHRLITDAVHKEGGKIALQVLHAGRYAYHPWSVAPSAIKSAITPFKPWALTGFGVKKTIRDFVNCARKAQQAGYDGVEVMGSEGYLINEFIVSKTNHRRDQWGGSYENRIRFPVEIVREIRKAVGPDFLIIYRLSLLDLVPEGSDWNEILHLARAIEEAGASLINTGIGWHEARIPTIASMVPRASFAQVTAQLKPHLRIPMIATNRINTPEVAEQILQDGGADLVSMARPLLADAFFVQKSRLNRAQEINTCIACNQACLDHIFKNETASCLVNPRAGRELELPLVKTLAKRRIFVIGAGPAGLAFAVTAAERGHDVEIFDAHAEIGGQFNLAKKIPGKSEFYETLRYYSVMLKKFNVKVHLQHKISAQEIQQMSPDHVVVATGIRPRQIELPGEAPHKLVSYIDVLNGRAQIGNSVAIIGAGGIGFDVAEYLSNHAKNAAHDLGHELNHNLSQASVDSDKSHREGFAAYWGIDFSVKARGGVDHVPRQIPAPARKIYLLQRSDKKLGEGLGKTTGWIHRTQLKEMKVEMLNSVQYDRIDQDGLHITRFGKSQILPVDQVVVCAGQVSENSLFTELSQLGVKSIHLIGGARVAAELDAKRAIEEATRLALKIEGDLHDW